MILRNQEYFMTPHSSSWIPKGILDPKGRYFYFGGENILALTKPINGEPASHGNGMTIGFSAQSSDLVDSWYDSVSIMEVLHVKILQVLEVQVNLNYIWHIYATLLTIKYVQCTGFQNKSLGILNC